MIRTFLSLKTLQYSVLNKQYLILISHGPAIILQSPTGPYDPLLLCRNGKIYYNVFAGDVRKCSLFICFGTMDILRVKSN